VLDAVLRRPRSVLCAAALVALTSLAGLVSWPEHEFRLGVDPSLRALLPMGSRDLATFEEVGDRFTSDDLLFVAWVHDELFTPARLAAFKLLTRRIERIPGVIHVESLATAPRTVVHPDYSEVQGFLAELPRTAEAAEALREAALRNPLTAGYLVSSDGRGALVSVRFQRGLSARTQLAIVREIATASRTAAGDVEQFLSGPLYVRLEMSRLLLADLARVMPLAVGVTLLVVAVVFRHTAGVVLPFAANLLALGVTLALFVSAGHQLSYVTVILPPTIYVVGFAYAIHVISDFDRHRARGCERAEATRAALADCARPLFFSALTTVCGFASLATSNIESIRLFGAYAAIGTALAWCAAVCLVPAGLLVWPARRAAHGAASGTSAAAARLARLAMRHGGLLVAGGAVLALGSVAGALRIEVGTDYLANFAPDNPVHRNFERMNSLFAGAVPLQIVLAGAQPDTFKEPRALRAVAALEDWLDAQAEIGGVYTLLDYIALIEQALTPEQVDADRVPASRDLVSHLLLLGGGEDLGRFTDAGLRHTLIQVRCREIASADLNALSDRIEARLASLPPGMTGYVTGSSYLVARTLDEVTRGQLLSLAAVLVPVLAVMAWLMRSLGGGLLALIPNLLPVLVFFGVLGWSGITLNLTTSLIASVVFGIAVDDTVHLLARLRSARLRGLAGEAALAAARWPGSRRGSRPGCARYAASGA
jgi:uncharacterized protein